MPMGKKVRFGPVCHRYFNPSLSGFYSSNSFEPLCYHRHECKTCAAGSGACASCDPAKEKLVDGQCRAVKGEKCAADADCSSLACGNRVCCAEGGCTGGQPCDSDSDCATGVGPCRNNVCLAKAGDACTSDKMCVLSTCNGSKCCAQSTIRLTPVLLGSNTLCTSSGRDVIRTKALCEAAAKAVGMRDTSASAPPFSKNPPGCFAYNPTSLYFNPSVSGTDRSSSFEPLCHDRSECATCTAGSGACLSCDSDKEKIVNGQCRKVGGERCVLDADCTSSTCGKVRSPHLPPPCSQPHNPHALHGVVGARSSPPCPPVRDPPAASSAHKRTPNGPGAPLGSALAHCTVPRTAGLPPHRAAMPVLCRQPLP